MNFSMRGYWVWKNKPVDAAWCPSEDIDLVKPEEGILEGIVFLLFQRCHYEWRSLQIAEWLVQYEYGSIWNTGH